jgi:hypothetical protein
MGSRQERCKPSFPRVRHQRMQVAATRMARATAASLSIFTMEHGSIKSSLQSRRSLPSFTRVRIICKLVIFTRFRFHRVTLSNTGQYRLNFSGRVLTPSVKNMQLENEQGEVLLQFGKVDEHRFHLDFRAPFTAFSAFAAALCQFDL